MPSPVASYDSFDFASEVVSLTIGDPIRLAAVAVPKRHGGLIQDVPVRDAKRVTFGLTVYGRDYDVTNPEQGARARIDAYLAKTMLYNKKLRLHDDRYLNAYPAALNYVPRQGSALTVWDLSWDFICLDPFFYSDTPGSQVINLTAADTIIDITNGHYSEQVVINNNGSAFVYPKVVVDCTSGAPKRFKVQFDNLTTGKSWTYEFDYTSGTKRVVVDAGIFSVTLDGSDDLTNWQGTFVWLEPGNNTIRVSGSVDATYTITWSPRYS